MVSWKASRYFDTNNSRRFLCGENTALLARKEKTPAEAGKEFVMGGYRSGGEGLREKDPFLEEVGQLFVGQSQHVSESLDVIDKLIVNAGKSYNDALVTKWLEVYEHIVFNTIPPVNDVSVNDFYERLRGLYWHLPQVKKVPIPPAGDVVYHNTLLKTREWILRRVIKGWYPQRISASIKTFQFLLAVYAPTKERLELCGTSIETVIQEAEGTNREIRTIVIDLMREHTDAAFRPETIEELLSVEEDMPMEIAEILLHAWARNGGWLLMQRHLRNKKILGSFEPEKRSEAACKFLEHLGYVVAALENDVARLFATIPEELRKGAKYQYDRLDKLSLSFYFVERQSPEKEARLYDQTRTAIERWIEWEKASGLKVCVYFSLRFGDELTSEFRKGEWMFSK